MLRIVPVTMLYVEHRGEQRAVQERATLQLTRRLPGDLSRMRRPLWPVSNALHSQAHSKVIVFVGGGLTLGRPTE